MQKSNALASATHLNDVLFLSKWEGYLSHWKAVITLNNFHNPLISIKYNGTKLKQFIGKNIRISAKRWSNRVSTVGFSLSNIHNLDFIYNILPKTTYKFHQSIGISFSLVTIELWDPWPPHQCMQTDWYLCWKRNIFDSANYKRQYGWNVTSQNYKQQLFIWKSLSSNENRSCSTCSPNCRYAHIHCILKIRIMHCITD